MFGIKKRREAKAQRLEQEKREREIQAKISIRRTLNMMKKQSSKLDDFKKEYIEKARKASLVGNKQTYSLAKSGLKMCLIKQKFLDTMISNFEISMQINDMNKVINEFVRSTNTLSEQMKGVTSTLDMTKAQAAYDQAIANNAGQYEALDAFLNEAVDSIESMDDTGGEVSDDELDKLITSQVMDGEDDIDKEIDQKIREIKTKIDPTKVN